MLQKSEYVEVPILHKFDQKNVIGWLKIKREALRATPDFVFSLGVEVKGASSWKDLDNDLYEYELVCISPVTDANYIEYLRKRNKI